MTIRKMTLRYSRVVLAIAILGSTLPAYSQASGGMPNGLDVVEKKAP